MATHGILASTALMSVLLVAVGVWMARLRNWRAPSAAARGSGGPPALPGERAVERTTGDQRAWIAISLAVGAALVGGGVLAVQGSIDAMLVVIGVGAVVGAYFVLGVYVMARSRRHSTARALAESLIVGATALMLVVALNLVVGV